MILDFKLLAIFVEDVPALDNGNPLLRKVFPENIPFRGRIGIRVFLEN